MGTLLEILKNDPTSLQSRLIEKIRRNLPKKTASKDVQRERLGKAIDAIKQQKGAGFVQEYQALEIAFAHNKGKPLTLALFSKALDEVMGKESKRGARIKARRR